jgi:outer membrane immunogenic protein
MASRIGHVAATAAATALFACALGSIAHAEGYSGPYIGIAAFYGVSNTDASVYRVSAATTTSATIKTEGVSLAGAAGYDWKVGHSGVVGVVSDIALTKPGDSLSYVLTLRARAGVLVTPNTLLYATGGAAFLKSDLSGKLGGYEYSLKSWAPGWTVGAGLEQRVLWGAQPVRIGLEAAYLDFSARRFEVIDRQAKLDTSAWSIGTRLSFELNR